MAAPFSVRIDDFQGVARDVHPGRLPPGLFQRDEGGDLFERGTWKLRRGRTRIASVPLSNPLETVFPFESRVGSAVLALIDSAGNFQGWNQEPNGVSVSLENGVVTATFPSGLHNFATEYKRTAYFSNGWTRMRRWSGNWYRRVDFSGSDEFEEVPYAGIEPPPDQATYTKAEGATAADEGPCTEGDHGMRIRWKDSQTGYVSNANEATTVNVSAADKKLTFTIGSGANEIDEPTDAKVDTLLIEWTVVGGSEYFLAAEHLIYSRADGSLNASVVVDISDEALAQSVLPYEEDGHDLPPAKQVAYAFRDRLWLFGDVVYSAGTVSTTLSDATVTGSGTQFSEYALGTSSEAPITGRRFFRGTSSEFYGIAERTSNTALELDRTIGYATASNYSYGIFSSNNLIYYSRLDEPESWPALNFITLPTGSGSVVAGVGFDDSMLFFSQRGAWRFSYRAEPSDGQAYPIPGNRGALSQRVVVQHDGRVYALDGLGVWSYEGGLPVDVSRPIERLFREELDFSQASKWHGAYYPRARAIRWYVVRTGDSRPKFYLQYDPVRRAWSTGYEDVAITESALGHLAFAGQPLGPLVTILGDENGHVWRADTGSSDGGGSVHHPTVVSGSTTTTVECTPGSLPGGHELTTGSLRGCPVYRLATGEVRVISSHTADDFTVSSAFGSSPTAGETIWLGRIRGLLRSPVFHAPRYGPKDKVEPQTLRFFYRPLDSARKLMIRVYEQYSSTARTWSSYERANTSLTYPGTVTGYATSDWLWDLSDASGVAEIQLGMKALRSFYFELEVWEPDTELELWGIEVTGVEAQAL